MTQRSERGINKSVSLERLGLAPPVWSGVPGPISQPKPKPFERQL